MIAARPQVPLVTRCRWDRLQRQRDVKVRQAEEELRLFNLEATALAAELHQG